MTENPSEHEKKLETFERASSDFMKASRAVMGAQKVFGGVLGSHRPRCFAAIQRSVFNLLNITLLQTITNASVLFI